MAKKSRPKKVERKGISFQSINQVLPIEMLKKILEFLDIKSLCFAQLSCKYWKDVIDEFELVKKATSKFQKLLSPRDNL